MAKLYVFGIGGTGSRTLRALSMLLASGVECKFETVVPVIIDPDASAADMTRTVDALTRYMEVSHWTLTLPMRINSSRQRFVLSRI